NQTDHSLETDLTDFDFIENLDENSCYWLNFYGLHDVSLYQRLAQVAKLDRITTTQILDTTMRPKVDEYDHYLFFSVKSMLNENGNYKIEQLSFVLGKHCVMSFQEELGDHFDHIRNKIKENLGLVRKKKVDFLLYQLLDAILDNYFETIEQVNVSLKSLEKEVLRNPEQSHMVELEQLKQFSEMIKKSLNPFKEALRVITNRQTPFIHQENGKYYQDLLSTCYGAVEEVDTTIKSIEGLTNIYFSSLSQKMNETMKVLTTVATIFIPLTFIAGIYGMNFDNMPELHYPYGYHTVWGVMGLVFIGMVIYFKRKKWL
ncbi:MAG: magnesium/cobalt transporter CorA, partial [Bacteroidota bacterium]